MELIKAQIKDECLQTNVGFPQAVNDKMDKDSEFRENGLGGSLSVLKQLSKYTDCVCQNIPLANNQISLFDIYGTKSIIRRSGAVLISS